jgi:hypothetical protein
VGPHDVEVHAPGHDALTLYDLELEKAAEFRLEPIENPGTVVVRVLGPEGRPQAGLRVGLNAGSANIDVVLRTDEQGRCRFEAAAPGGAVVHVEPGEWYGRSRAERWAEDEGVLSKRIRVPAGGEVEARLGLVPAESALAVVVRGPAGAPCPGVEVGLFGNRMESADTDASGTVRFEKLPAGNYVLSLGPWHSRRELVLRESQEMALELVRGEATLRGRTEPGAGVSLKGPGSEMLDVAEDGTFAAVEIPPGTWVLQAWTKDRLSLPVEVEVKVAESPEPVELPLVPCGRILVDFRAPDRVGLGRAAIRVLDDRGERVPLTLDRDGECDRKTPRVLPGRYEIEVAVPGGEPRRTTVEVVGGEDVRVEMGLP